MTFLKGLKVSPLVHLRPTLFYILRHSLCPAVLTENFFMDNLSDLEYLQSRVGKQAVVDTHVEAITEYLSSL